MEEGNSRFSTGYKYWNINSKDEFYNLSAATEEAKKDARDFLKFQSDRLTKAAELLTDSDFVSLVCTVDLDKLRNNWSEGLTLSPGKTA